MGGVWSYAVDWEGIVNDLIYCPSGDCSSRYRVKMLWILRAFTPMHSWLASTHLSGEQISTSPQQTLSIAVYQRPRQQTLHMPRDNVKPADRPRGCAILDQSVPALSRARLGLAGLSLITNDSTEYDPLRKDVNNTRVSFQAIL